MKILYFVLVLLLILAACASVTPTVPPPTTAAPQNIQLPTLPPAGPTVLSSDMGQGAGVTNTVPDTTDTPSSTPTPPPAASATIFPTPFAGTLTLRERQSFSVDCDLPDPQDLPSKGFEQLGFVPTGDCQNGEIGLFQVGSNTYIAQSGLFGAAFTITDVTNPTAPQLVGIWELASGSHTLDLKTFKQGERQYVALGLQRGPQQPELPCGIVVIDVTTVREPQLVTRLDGRNVGAPEMWCNVHSLEVDTDAQGNATFFIVSDVDTYSARAIDIRDLENARETNFYHLHAHPHTAPNQPVLNYVHDSYVAGDKVYLANWLAGVVILDKETFEAGMPQEAIIVKPTDNVAPGGFHVHYVVPVANGDFVFIQDELDADNGLRLLDIRDPQNPQTVWVETNSGGVNAPHNFVVRDNLLIAGWYNDGVKMFRFAIADPENPTVEEVGFQQVRSNKNITRERYFDGVWGVRVNDCTVRNVQRVCVYASDMSSGLIILALES